MAKPIQKPLWTSIDSIGLLNGLGVWDSQYKKLLYVRRPFDTAIEVRSKILSSNDYRPGTTKQGLINALNTEFSTVPYNAIDRKVFTLSYSPVPVGTPDETDILVYYKTLDSDDWIAVTPQVWATDYSTSKENKEGFIVWQVNKYSNRPDIKNFTYSNVLEIFQDLEDECQIKVEYYVYAVDDSNTRTLVKYTDMNNQEDSDDERYTYRKFEEPSVSGNIIAYTLNDIPSNLLDNYYNATGQAKSLMYRIRDHIDKKYKHKWKDISDKSCIWDVHKSYGSGELPSFYDAEVPKTHLYATSNAFTGGVENLSDALYCTEIRAVLSSGFVSWCPVIFPGRFYLAGIPYYLFEDPIIENITFTAGEATLPSGIERGTKVILANSGYYDNLDYDLHLSGCYEDYDYDTGDGSFGSTWKNVYRKIPYLTALDGVAVVPSYGEYQIDYTSGKIYAHEDITNATIIWDNVLVPSGRVLDYDLNPLNESYSIFKNFFLYLTTGV